MSDSAEKGRFYVTASAMLSSIQRGSDQFFDTKDVESEKLEAFAIMRNIVDGGGVIEKRDVLKLYATIVRYGVASGWKDFTDVND
ncbi:MAG TPA: hypothetical protein PKM65_20560 [Spirochaetota bacterium]|nr:hypothetical protein [Spirochaetota bacterium]